MAVLQKYNDLPVALDELSKSVVNCIFQVHKKLGPGYLEKIYEDCLCIEFEEHRLDYQRQRPVHIIYNGQKIPSEFKLDLVVEDKILIELKAVDRLIPVFDAQVYSYLKSSNLPLGFLVNYNVPLIKDGIKRFVSKDFASSDLRAQKEMVNS
jgi:GxxExxY protein